MSAESLDTALIVILSLLVCVGSLGLIFVSTVSTQRAHDRYFQLLQTISQGRDEEHDQDDQRERAG